MKEIGTNAKLSISILHLSGGSCKRMALALLIDTSSLLDGEQSASDLVLKHDIAGNRVANLTLTM